MEQVVLVDTMDRELGIMEKMQAHQLGVLHRAFSIILINNQNELLLQKRAYSKYHCAGLWSNTVCSHPRPGESLSDACSRRLLEEMGIRAQVKKVFDFIYKVKLTNDIYEHEFDHVFIASYSGKPTINIEEVAAWKYMPVAQLVDDVKINKKEYTPWFQLIINKYGEQFIK